MTRRTITVPAPVFNEEKVVGRVLGWCSLKCGPACQETSIHAASGPIYPLKPPTRLPEEPEDS